MNNVYFSTIQKIVSLIFIFLILIVSLKLTIYANSGFEEEIHKKIKNCNNLNFFTSKFLQKENFKKFNINLKIHDEREWKKTLLKNKLSFVKNNVFNTDKKIDAELIFFIDDYKCVTKATIKPHGDTPVHFLDEDKNILKLPSIKVNLIDNNIFGITKFILFKPSSRHYSNEVFTATLLHQLGILAPRTTFVNVKFEESSYEFIFQERIVKEFLENNKLIEGPIIKGDERFSFNYWYLDEVVSSHKVSNVNWVLKSKNNKIVSKKALNVINYIDHFNDSEIEADKVADYSHMSKLVNLDSYFNEFELFDSAMYALSSVHNLSREDRRFYFDSVKNKFVPIYYDGKGRILNKKNEITENFKNLKNNWYFSMIHYEDQDSKMRSINDKVTPSSIKGAGLMISKLNSLDLNLLQTNLSKRGLNLSEEKIVRIIYLIKKNLEYLKNLHISDSLNIKIDLNKQIQNTEIQSKLKAKYIFDNNLNNNYLICDLNLSNCEEKYSNEINHKKLLEQTLTTNNNEFDLVYKGQINHFVNKSIDLEKNSIEIFNLNNDFELVNINDNNIEINKNQNIIFIEKINQNGKILINGNINNWKFYFTDKNKNENYDISRDENGLTGCINIYDSLIKNVSFYIDDAKCEDGLNIVRSNGWINHLDVYNSISDGVDFDFSNLMVKNAKIEKSGGDCIDFSYGIYNLINARLDRCYDKSISLGEKSNLKVNLAEISESNIALASKDSSEATIENIKIKETTYCLQAYNKKPEFSGAAIFVNKISCNNTLNRNEYNSADNRSIILFN